MKPVTDANFRRLRWCFIDPGGMSYHPFTPTHEALGGTQSGLCYLIRALHRLGHELCLYNRSCTKNKDSYFELRSLDAFNSRDLAEFDLIVVVNEIDFLLEQSWPDLPILFWCHHLAPAVDPQQLHILAQFCQNLILISDWQKNSFQHFHELKGFKRVKVLKNAVAPIFEVTATRWPQQPTLAYTSTPMRGLEVLMAIYPYLKQRFPDLQLNLFSSFEVYQISQAQDGFGALYEICKNSPGVHFFGGVSQNTLARALSQSHILAYPCTFAETSCISAMEAMAAGCQIVSTARAALPETTAGFARLIPYQADQQSFAKAYFLELCQAIEQRFAFAEHSAKQRQYVLQHLTWTQRALEWQRFALKILDAH